MIFNFEQNVKEVVEILKCVQEKFLVLSDEEFALDNISTFIYQNRKVLNSINLSELDIIDSEDSISEVEVKITELLKKLQSI